MLAQASELTSKTSRIVCGLPGGKNAEADIPTLLAFLRKNKYPLLAFDKTNSPDVWKSPEFLSARDEQASTMSSLRAEYIELRNAWLKAGIPCILIKSGGNAPSFPYLSDNLDILVREAHESRAREILQELGYVELKNVEEKQKFLFRKFVSGKSVSAIHLHTRVGWGVGFMNEDSLWERSCVSRDDTAIRVPSPEDTIMITLAHGFYENKRFRLADVVKVRCCLQRGEVDWDYMEKVALQTGWLSGLCFCVLVYAHLEKTLWGKTIVPQPITESYEIILRSSPIINRYYLKTIQRSPVSLPFTFSFFFSKLFFYRKILNDKRYSTRARLCDVSRTLIRGIRLKAGIWPQPSFLVTFSGPDGSGKTQQARALLDALACCGLKAEYYWDRYGTSGITHLVSRLSKTVIRGQENKKSRPGPAGRGTKLRNPTARLVWCYLAAADVIVSSFIHVRLRLLRGKIVVCDRYVYDAIAEMRYSLPGTGRLMRLAARLMLALVPKPDVSYYLDVSEEVCARRGGEKADVLHLREQRTAYALVLKSSNLKVISGERTISNISNEVSREVITCYFDDFATFLNGIFLSNPDQINRNRQDKSLRKRARELKNALETGQKLLSKGKFSRALSLSEKALKIDSQNAAAWVLKGNALLSLKRSDEALSASGRAIEIDPDNPLAWALKGHALRSLGRNDEALLASRKGWNLSHEVGLPQNT